MNKLQAYWGFKRPTVAIYETVITGLPEKEAEKLRCALFRLAFGYWAELPAYYRKFLIRLYVHDRDMFLRLLLHHSPLGSMRYPLLYADLFMKMTHLLQKSEKGKKTSFRHLAFSMLLAFDYPYTINTLSVYLARKKPDAEEVFMLAGRKILFEDF